MLTCCSNWRIADMKPDPIHTPPARPLSDSEKLFLEVSAAGGVHAFRLHGQEQFRTARALVKLGLGELDGNMFKATTAGMAAIAEPDA